jgi:hypothetical protein
MRFRRSVCLLRFVICGGIFICGGVASALAYEESGHFYTVAATLSGLTPKPMPPSALRIVEFCSYLPDEAEELNAVTVYYTMANPYHFPYGGLLWGVLRAGTWSYGSNQISIRRMVMVQQQLHSLTGAPSSASTDFALELVHGLAGSIGPLRSEEDVAANKDKLCAVGFGLHLLGDSYAHRQLSNPAIMYGTGLGHAADNSYPDLPMYNQQPHIGPPANPDGKDHNTCTDADYQPDCGSVLQRSAEWGRCYVTSLKELFPGARLDQDIQCKEWQLEGQAVSDTNLALNTKEPHLRTALCQAYRRELKIEPVNCPDETNDDLLPQSDGTQYFSTYVIQEDCQPYLDRVWKSWNTTDSTSPVFMSPATEPNCESTWNTYHQLLWIDPGIRAKFISLLPIDLRKDQSRLKCMEDVNLWSEVDSCE